ncbi:hypothetical protein E2562_037604 [Oryza meyeriana var. granulata]|uniref:Uncharacterized protein n=1 Tax=Oryza meyeriana var. granulata TaxID=110450 RepID=A0A6G1CXM5_9ORYZ|nr:hypothetical protein E2562_037604 [Oryza meyeriana var. granulata]
MEESNMARRLWHVVRAVLFMLRKGMSKRKLAMDLHLLLHRGKIAGKALGKIMTTAHGHGYHDHHAADASAAEEAPPLQPFSCRALDPALAVYDPRGAGREVEFSCSNTPSYPSFHFMIPTKRRRRNNRGGRGANGGEPGWYNYDAADIARVFEILNSSDQLLAGGDDGGAGAPLAVAATPSPALWSTSFSRSPAPVRQLRITDSPFPLRDDDAAAGDGGLVDLEAEEFIKKFYEQLRTQQSLATATPDYYGYSRPVTGVAY